MTLEDRAKLQAKEVARRSLRTVGGEKRRVVVAGYGPVGRVVVDLLESAGAQVTVVELNLDTVEHQLDLDRRVVYGDITQQRVQIMSGVPVADALILAIPNEHAAVAACEMARRLAPEIFIAARTNYVSQGMLASQAGADYVVIEEVVTAQAMKQAVLDRFLTHNDAEEKS